MNAWETEVEEISRGVFEGFRPEIHGMGIVSNPGGDYFSADGECTISVVYELGERQIDITFPNGSVMTIKAPSGTIRGQLPPGAWGASL